MTINTYTRTLRRLIFVGALGSTFVGAPLATADLVDDEAILEEDLAPKTRKGKKASSSQGHKKAKQPKKSKRTNATGETPQSGAHGGKNAQQKASKKEDQAEKRRQPVNFEGEQLSGSRKTGILKLNRNVRIRQGDLHLSADKATVYFNQARDEVERVVAEGAVRMTKIDAKTERLAEATGDVATFNALKQEVRLTGRARFRRDGDTMKGHVITYDLESGWISADKVTGVVNPNEQAPDASTKEGEPKPATPPPSEAQGDLGGTPDAPQSKKKEGR